MPFDKKKSTFYHYAQGAQSNKPKTLVLKVNLAQSSQWWSGDCLLCREFAPVINFNDS